MTLATRAAPTPPSPAGPRVTARSVTRGYRLNGFDPLVFDGRDPAAFVWAIVEMEQRLAKAAERVRAGDGRYPVRLPYGVAVAPTGAGFYGEGTNLAHNLPLGANPHSDPTPTHASVARRSHVGSGRPSRGSPAEGSLGLKWGESWPSSFGIDAAPNHADQGGSTSSRRPTRSARLKSGAPRA